MKKSNFWKLVFSKRTLITVLATLALLVVVRGTAGVIYHAKYKNMTMEQRIEKKSAWKVNKLAKKLNLTDDQKTKMMAMMTANMTNMKKIRESQMTKMDADMKAVLSPEQYQKWSAMMAKKRHHKYGKF